MALHASICTMSLGRCSAGHSLRDKLAAAASNGFSGIELFYEDLVGMAVAEFGSSSQHHQLCAANVIRRLCAENHQTIICLQPFMHFGGLKSREKHQENMETLKFWIQLCHTLDTDLIVFPSSFLPAAQLSDDPAMLVRDMQEAADLGMQASPPIRFAFEALCWGTRQDLWEHSWQVVQDVNRPNFGMCLDAFNIAGRVFADPEVRYEVASSGRAALEASLDRMVREVDMEKVFLVQLADAEMLQQPLDESHMFHVDGQPPRMSWSRNCRLFYGEERRGGYLPITAIMQTVTKKMGYEGWVSFEVFNRDLFYTDETVPATMAKRARVSWSRLLADLQSQPSSGLAAML